MKREVTGPMGPLSHGIPFGRPLTSGYEPLRISRLEGLYTSVPPRSRLHRFFKAQRRGVWLELHSGISRFFISEFGSTPPVEPEKPQ